MLEIAAYVLPKDDDTLIDVNKRDAISLTIYFVIFTLLSFKYQII